MHVTTKRSGFTLVEATIGIALLALVMGAAFIGMNGIAKGYSQEYKIQRMDGRARRAIKQIREFLEEAGRDMLTPAPASPLGAETIDFRRLTGFTDGAPVFGATQRILFELDPLEVENGEDDDGDGLIDEHQIVFVRNVDTALQSSTVVARSVSSYLEGESPTGNDDNDNGLIDERGLSLELVDGTMMVIRLTIECESAGQQPLQQTAVAVIHLRN